MRVIVFALHGCPAGWLGAYGNDWVGTPNLDRLAAEGVTFDRHISDCPEPSAARKAWRGSEEPNPPTPFPGREGGVLSSPSPLAGEGGSRSEPGEGLAIPVVEVSPLTRSLRSLPSPARGEGETQAPPSLPGKGVGGLGSSTHTILVRANHPDTDAPA